MRPSVPTARNLAQTLSELDTASRSILVAEWRRLYRVEPPRFASSALLRRAVAYAMQEREQSGLSTAIRRELSAIARGSPPSVAAPRQCLKQGTKLLREWHSTTHEVLVIDNGFVWQGQTYRSLSAVAFAITGAKWSGHRFFGLRSRRETKDGGA
jgi:hypothetical protein